jgi:starch phosphorylase
VTSKAKRADNPVFGLLPADLEDIDSLVELALDMRWSWNHATDDVWRQLDPVLWELTHNPWAVLQTLSRDRIEALSGDSVFRKQIDDAARAAREAAQTPTWCINTPIHDRR